MSELRLIKDDWEIEQMKIAVAATVEGFADVVRALPRALTHKRGERVVEGAFFARAREEGNELGYDTIAASGNNATVLHWNRNSGTVNAGELLLLDAGVEADSLYTADITRTLPATGTFTDVQRKVYEAVLDAADAGFAAAQPGVRFRDIHTAATTVLAERLAEWGLLPVSVEEAISGGPAAPPLDAARHQPPPWPGRPRLRAGKARALPRWHPHRGHGFHHRTRLYFKNEDLAIPEEYRGIGVRIEDDILMTADGPLNLSAALPRKADDVESWMAGIYQEAQG